jgi:hypothetical protein
VKDVSHDLSLPGTCLLCVEQYCTEQELFSCVDTMVSMVSTQLDTIVFSYQTVHFKKLDRLQSLTLPPRG